jgi:hypothetical protein
MTDPILTDRQIRDMNAFGEALSAEARDFLYGPRDEASLRRQRILLKLGALWDSEPERSLSAIIAWHLPDFQYCVVSDETTEADLDALLAAKGLTVSGGWKS